MSVYPNNPLAGINIPLPENCPGIFTVEVVARLFGYVALWFFDVALRGTSKIANCCLVPDGNGFPPSYLMFFELICLYSLLSSASINCLLLHMFPIPGSLGILPPRSTFLGSVIPTPHRRLGVSYHGTRHRFDFVRRSRPTVLTISSQSSL